MRTLYFASDRLASGRDRGTVSPIPGLPGSGLAREQISSTDARPPFDDSAIARDKGPNPCGDDYDVSRKRSLRTGHAFCIGRSREAAKRRVSFLPAISAKYGPCVSRGTPAMASQN